MKSYLKSGGMTSYSDDTEGDKGLHEVEGCWFWRLMYIDSNVNRLVGLWSII